MSTQQASSSKLSSNIDTSHLKVKFPFKAKYGNYINGKFVEPKSGKYFDNTTVALVIISNSSDAPYTLRNQSKYDFYNLTDLVIVPAHGEVNIDVRTIKKTRKFELEFEVLSALTAPQTHPVINIIIRVNQ